MGLRKNQTPQEKLQRKILPIRSSRLSSAAKRGGGKQAGGRWLTSPSSSVKRNVRGVNNPQTSKINAKKRAQRQLLLCLVVLFHFVEKPDLSQLHWQQHYSVAELEAIPASIWQKATKTLEVAWKRETIEHDADEDASSFAEWIQTLYSRWFSAASTTASAGSSNDTAPAALIRKHLEQIQEAALQWALHVKDGTIRVGNSTLQALLQTSRLAKSSSVKVRRNLEATPAMVASRSKRLAARVGHASKAVLSFQLNAIDLAASLIVTSTQSFVKMLPLQNNTTMSGSTLMTDMPHSRDQLQQWPIPKNLHLPNFTNFLVLGGQHNDDKECTTTNGRFLGILPASTPSTPLGMPHLDPLPSSPQKKLRVPAAPHEDGKINNLSQSKSVAWKAATDHSSQKVASTRKSTVQLLFAPRPPPDLRLSAEKKKQKQQQQPSIPAPKTAPASPIVQALQQVTQPRSAETVFSSWVQRIRGGTLTTHYGGSTNKGESSK